MMSRCLMDSGFFFGWLSTVWKNTWIGHIGYILNLYFGFLQDASSDCQESNQSCGTSSNLNEWGTVDKAQHCDNNHGSNLSCLAHLGWEFRVISR